MKKSDEKAIRKKIKIDLENNMNPSEIAAKHSFSIERVKKIMKKRPLIFYDDEFQKYEKIRTYGCLDEFGEGEIAHADLEDIFYDASKLIVSDGSKKRYRNLVFPIEPREWEIRQVICDVLSKKQFNYLIECPIKNPLSPDNRKNALWTDLSILTKSGIVDIELKNACKSDSIRPDFRKLLSAPISTVGTACFYLSNDTDTENRLPTIISAYNKAYRAEIKSIGSYGIEMYDKWFFFFLFAFHEKRTFSCYYESIMDVNLDYLMQSEFRSIE